MFEKDWGEEDSDWRMREKAEEEIDDGTGETEDEEDETTKQNFDLAKT